MTSNTISYALMKEQARHNIMDEAIRQVSNAENIRHNVATETQSRLIADEQRRHNYTDESKNWYSAYTTASNQQLQASAAMQQAVTAQQAQTEAARHNYALEQIDLGYKSVLGAKAAAEAAYIAGPQTQQSTAQTTKIGKETGMIPLQQDKLITDIELMRANAAYRSAETAIKQAEVPYASWNAAVSTINKTAQLVSSGLLGYKSIENEIHGTNIPVEP